MPRYWFTKHFPHPKVQRIPWNIYLETKDDAIEMQLSKNDCRRVLLRRELTTNHRVG